MKKKVIIITFVTIIILTAILIIGFNFRKNNKKDKVKEVKVEIKKEKETKKESDKNESNNEDRNESIQDNQSNNNSNNNSSSNVYQNDMEVNSVVDSNVSVDNKEQSTPVVNNEPVSNSGPWDAFGMSEYDYYNKPMYSWERVDFNSMNECINYGENYEPYKNGLELYNCRYVTSASGNTLGVMFDTEKLN